MSSAKDLVGSRFGRLIVRSRVAPQPGKNPRWLCTCDCGQAHEAYGHNLVGGKTKSCGCFLRGPTSYKAKHRLIHDGYALLKMPEHPRANRHTGRVREHILVMEEVLGRPLSAGENVHHKNGVRDDNRPSNLELWVVSQPKGQRPGDLVEWAREILARYGDE